MEGVYAKLIDMFIQDCEDKGPKSRQLMGEALVQLVLSEVYLGGVNLNSFDNVTTAHAVPGKQPPTDPLAMVMRAPRSSLRPICDKLSGDTSCAPIAFQLYA